MATQNLCSVELTFCISLPSRTPSPHTIYKATCMNSPGIPRRVIYVGTQRPLSWPKSKPGPVENWIIMLLRHNGPLVRFGKSQYRRTGASGASSYPQISRHDEMM
uniref:Uncharacterized protein n=1 Tax=Physcomitrium patens TaxID=3218 RepID=A0A2K1JYB0_PHYPA|nr:hypothetical protein PHYPA_013632 [Physcomitrium patens]